MERTEETLKARVREAPLTDRLSECRKRIGKMCAEGRAPRMCIPVQHDDDDFFICTTLADAQATVEALQLERNEAIEAASLPTWVCDGCGRVSSDGWINHVIESLDGTDYEMECPTCGVRDIEEDCALDLVRERDDLQAALDAEREKVKGLEQEAERLRIVNRGHINEGFKDMKTIEELTAAFAKAQAQLSQLQALVRAYFTEPDPHKWTAAYQTLKRMGRALPATPTESGEDHSGDDTDMVQQGGGDGE